MTTKPLGRATSILCVSALPLLASCGGPREPAAPAAVVAPDHARIDLHLRVMTEADAKARAVCEAGVAGVLRYHGFVLDPGGVRVDVDVDVLRDVVAGTPSFGDAPVQVQYNTPSPAPPSTEPGQNAELDARVYVSGAPPRVLRAAGSAQAAACAVAAERFATALVEALGATPAAAAAPARTR